MTTQLSVCKNVENYDVHKNYFPFSYPEKEASLWSNSGPTAASNYSELPKRCYLVLCLPVYAYYM